MAEVYGVPVECVLPIRGVTHGLELVLRRIRRDGGDGIDGVPSAELDALVAIYGLQFRKPGEPVGARILWSLPDEASVDAFLTLGGASLLVVDESGVEFEESPSLAPAAARRDDLVVLRSLSLAYGLAGAPCGALIGSPASIAAYQEVLEPFALPTPIVRLAEAALSPSRALATEARIALVNRERTRMVEALGASDLVERVGIGRAASITVLVVDTEKAKAGLARYRPNVAWLGGRALALEVGAPEANDRALAALGAGDGAKPHRRAEVVRDTKETKISVAIDLDAAGPRRIHTGVGFYDHMLDQIAAHGGFSLVLACEGDLEIDAHHTIEDCALAFGAALKQALGDRRGIGRFGFVLPMDETEAKVSIDLGGRPFLVFEGSFAQDHIGEWPTQMTPHVFRSIAESLGAAIHISVQGENDHHKVEACFKAFGRALRHAIRVEGDAVPSTKGVL
jgi:imidazoleglycerol phosphate dehydratase HisB